MKQYDPTIDTEFEMARVYSFPKEKINKEYLLNEENDNYLKKMEIKEFLDTIKPPLVPPPEPETKSF